MLKNSYDPLESMAKKNITNMIMPVGIAQITNIIDLLNLDEYWTKYLFYYRSDWNMVQWRGQSFRNCLQTSVLAVNFSKNIFRKES